MKIDPNVVELAKAIMESQNFLEYMNQKFDPAVAFDAMAMAMGIWCRGTDDPARVLQHAIKAMKFEVEER